MCQQNVLVVEGRCGVVEVKKIYDFSSGEEGVNIDLDAADGVGAGGAGKIKKSKESNKFLEGEYLWSADCAELVQKKLE